MQAREPGDDDWYVNLLWIERRKCLLLVHARTLFSVFAADVRKADLLPVGPAVVKLIQRELLNEKLPPNTFGHLEADAVVLARTASRIVLGYMNEMARFCEYTVAGEGGIRCFDIETLNRELRRELHLSRDAPGYIVPIELVHAQLIGMAGAGPKRHLRILH